MQKALLALAVAVLLLAGCEARPQKEIDRLEWLAEDEFWPDGVPQIEVWHYKESRWTVVEREPAGISATALP